MTLTDLEAACSSCGHPRADHRLGMCWIVIGQVIRGWTSQQWPITEKVYCWCMVFAA